MPYAMCTEAHLWETELYFSRQAGFRRHPGSDGKSLKIDKEEQFIQFYILEGSLVASGGGDTSLQR